MTIEAVNHPAHYGGADNPYEAKVRHPSGEMRPTRLCKSLAE